jgi:hypothetical protein
MMRVRKSVPYHHRRSTMQNIDKPVEHDTEKTAGGSSSPGKNLRSMTPKDVAPTDAAARDERRRQLALDEVAKDEHDEAMLDDAVEMTFPASDPIAVHPSDRHHANR